MPAVEALLADGADPNAADGNRNPPLYLAIEQQWVPLVWRLVAAGADVNCDLGQGWTPLVHAIDIESDAAWQVHHEEGHESTELTSFLLTAGAVPNERAIEVAKNYRNRKALALLKRAVRA